tara:strand:- start:250 stop:366 length:117 start_codon:yes stop_codon:yes gene_type:complete
MMVASIASVLGSVWFGVAMGLAGLIAGYMFCCKKKCGK